MDAGWSPHWGLHTQYLSPKRDNNGALRRPKRRLVMCKMRWPSSCRSEFAHLRIHLLGTRMPVVCHDDQVELWRSELHSWARSWALA
jgi:hypothetical protein